MRRQDDPPGPGPANDQYLDDHIYDYAYAYNANADDDANLTITIEELLSVLDEPPPPDNNFPPLLSKLPKDSTENTIAPENGNSDVSGLQKGPVDAPAFQSGEHGYSPWIPPNYLDVSHDEQGAALGCSSDVPGTSGNFSSTCAPALESEDFCNSPVDYQGFSCETHDVSSHWLALSLSDHGTRDTAADADPLFSRHIDHLQFSAPCHFVAKDASHYSKCTSSGRQEAGHAGDDSPFKMEFESAKEMMLPSSSLDMPKHGGSYPNDMFTKNLETFPGGDDSSCRELAQDSPNLGGNFCMSPSIETSSNCITGGCSTGDSSNGIFSEDITTYRSSQCLQPQAFQSTSMEAPMTYTDEERDGHARRLFIENQTNLVAPARNFGIFPLEMPIININPTRNDINYHQDVKFKHPSSTESSSFLINGTTSFGDFHGRVVDSTRYIGSKQVIPKTCSKDQLEDGLPASQHDSSIDEVTLVNNPQNSKVDEDAEVCILDNDSTLIGLPLPSVPVRSHAVVPRAGYADTIYPEESTSWPKAHDERLTFRIALQDLSQPTSEATPPDGVLAVPLLRHQRIALSWMVQKETTSPNCSGGILADDQGLGKTVSTIALILAERSPLIKNCGDVAKIVKIETLSLDDDDEAAEINGISQPLASDLVSKKKPREGDNGLTSVKGRPAAGTLVVCPTSVLRQWAEELQNKVTSKGNLSFLVYHGSNRTKDPNELSKYDVVLTTYSIVSMEVPKQLSSDKDDEAKGKSDAHPSVVSSTKKRKHPTTKSSRNTKARTITDNTLLEATARPLARVAWFRVILDEAQTIKNHRTQVARACCGLRAKRRWCLSGTPIQNAIDDLFSYFKFLRYDPYAVYTSFCSTIKTPISRNPTNGYKKLQAVLKTIMLRRTKGTCIDGQPIINLPPKSITLRKVDFSQEERSFYSRLEAESREQFKVYADAGTVKQNYVNILLMLLRLRQACDHPHLVRGNDSNSVWKASLESAKRLPRDKQLHLLNCLEACLAICTICNDPPEDAVVTICGHVFCNQCIREHLTGDDSQCPSPHCKVKLDAVSVFPKDSLKSSVVDMPVHAIPPDGSCYELSSELSRDVGCSDSSKIRAAIEILQSLPRLNDCSFITSSDVNTPCVMHKARDHCLANVSEVHTTEKAIVFSQWTRMLDLLEVRLKSSSLQYRRLDGTMSVAARDKAIRDFNTFPEVTVMILSLKAASLGLNMVAACHVLLLDLWWNPTTEDQAIDRAHRIGQTRPVTVSRLTVRDTVEDRILALQERKREMVASAFGEDETGGRQTRLTVEDLRYLFMA